MSTVCTIAILALGLQGRAHPILIVCKGPTGTVQVSRAGLSHTPKVAEKLQSGDKLVCGADGSIECYNVVLGKRMLFYPRTVVTLENASFRTKGPRPPLVRGLPSGMHLNFAGPGAGMFPSRGAGEEPLKITSPRFGLRELPTRIEWNWGGTKSAGSTFRVRLFQPAKFGGNWQVEGPIDTEVLDRTVPADKASFEVPIGTLAPGIPYVVEVSIQGEDRREHDTARFWALSSDQVTDLKSSEAAAAGSPDSDTKSFLGFLYWQLGLYRDALSQYIEVQGIKPDPGTADAIVRLRRLLGESK